MRPAAAGLGTALLGLTLSLVPWVLELEENAGLEWLFGWRGPMPAPADVVVVSIGADSAEALGLTSALNEWPRALHGELIDGLVSAGAAVIAFDIIFDRPRAAEQDRQLAAAIERAGNVVLLDRVRGEVIPVHDQSEPRAEAVVEVRVPPIEDFKRGALASAPFPLPRVPIKVSQFWVFGRGAGDVPTLPAVVLQAYALPVYEELVALLADSRPAEASHLPQGLDELLLLPGLEEAVRDIRRLFRAHAGLGEELRNRLEGRASAGDGLLRALVSMYEGEDSRYLRFYGPPRTVRTIPYHTALELLSDGQSGLDLEGAVVLVGFSERRQPEQQDDFYSVFSDRAGLNLSGVEIAATALGNLIEESSVRPLTMPAHLGLVAAWGAVLGASFALLPALLSIAIAAAASALYLTAASQQFHAAGIWLPMIVPLLVQVPASLFAAVLWNHRRLQVQRRRIQTALGYYLPPAAVDRLAHESIDLDAGRELLRGTCLVTDADHYTTLSEALGAEDLGRLMNDYYAVLVQAVNRHGGQVSDIGGDSMVAVWAATRHTPAAAERACRAALAIRAEVERFNRGRRPLELPTRIGLDSGELLLGNIGAEQRFEYRAVGDIVNTASRIQGLNRQLGTRVLASARALETSEHVISRELGTFLLLGKREALVIHELLPMDPTASGDICRLQERFSGALRHFRDGRWMEAAKRFQHVLDAFPSDGPSRFYLALCERFHQHAPPPGWDGTIQITAK